MLCKAAGKLWETAELKGKVVAAIFVLKLLFSSQVFK